VGLFVLIIISFLWHILLSSVVKSFYRIPFPPLSDSLNNYNLDTSTVSMNATTSGLSFVALNFPIPISATPLVTSASNPFNAPLQDLELYASAL
jgi:hypothetical protein